MQRLLDAIMVLCLCFVAVAYAQHGHSGGVAGGGMGTAHPNASATHGNSGSPAANNSSSAHGKTMSDILSQNTKLSDKIHSLTGMDAQDACSGFKNLGQCVATAHVSNNLKISFACLKSDMTGTAPASTANCPAGTGTKSLSLGKSIQTLDPHADSKAEANRANKQASDDLKS